MKFFVVPDSSERWQTVIVVPGRLDAAVELRDRRVVPLLDLAEEDVGDRRAVELQALVDAVDLVRDGHRAEHGRDVDRRRPCPSAALISSSFIGESEAPKSTVPAVNCAMPPPEPMAW